ncbi:alkaline-phosphatase-like protein [Dichotomocladium elegans]|nr:alkaline-phosphatase-like protein [Dichotomocladium elegans]
MKFTCWQPPVLLSILAVTQLVGLALFARGFFPYKVYLPGFTDASQTPPWPDGSSQEPPIIEPQFDRLIFIVIDALRNDFILGQESAFDFVKSRIESGEAEAFTAKATAPTVTMPRIKALTTGTIPSFLDAILNIAESDTSSSLQYQDNWVHQLKFSDNRTIHFFGDDTWIRLFPDMFTEKEGTTSFYVSDTVEVDFNVTRHIKPVLSKQDWDAVIFHYLGLDHVGHTGGPRSPLMKPKQREMDQVIESIFEIVSVQDAHRIRHDADAKGTLMVICGDHGMNEEGNHGGSSVGETSAALVFMSPRFGSRPTLNRAASRRFKVEEEFTEVYGYPVVEQVDLVPTLACLFGFPIPRNNLGKVIVPMFTRQSSQSSLLRALQLNAYQISQLLKEVDDAFKRYLDNNATGIQAGTEVDPYSIKLLNEAHVAHKLFIQESTVENAEVAARAYLEFITFAQSKLTNTAGDYNLNDMSIGAVLILASALTFSTWAIRRAKFEKPAKLSFSQVFAIFILCGFAVSMFASSFIEEEHLIWYYCTTTALLLGLLESMGISGMPLYEKVMLVLSCLLQMVLLRLSTAWNSSTYAYIEKSLFGAEWHFLAASLVMCFLYGAHLIWNIGTKTGHHSAATTVVVSSSAGYLQLMIKIASIFIMGLCSALVMLYKVRVDGVDGTVPALYGRDLPEALEFATQLDQVALGKLIYNYCGASLFVFTALVYVTETAAVLHLPESDEGHSGYSSRHYLDGLLFISTPLWILFTRTHFAALFILFTIQFHLMRRWQSRLRSSGVYQQQQPGWFLAITATCMAHAAFFMTGHTNSIAAVDLSNAYIGISDYNAVIIGVLTFCSNWSTSIWWMIVGLILLLDGAAKDRTAEQRWWDYIVTQSAIFALFIAALSISVTLLREHLFIWTVFSPKYLYQVAWTCLFHWIFQALIGTVSMKLYHTDEAKASLN